MSTIDDLLSRACAKLAEVERERDAERAGRLSAKRRQEIVEAACAEMRAALGQVDLPCWVSPPCGQCNACRLRAILARVDLGRGMVAVPLGLLERVRYCLRRDSYDSSPDGMKVCRDLDALLYDGKAGGKATP